MVKIGFGRIYWFTAAHRLHSPALSDEENYKIYDICNNLNGHGHDYKLEVTVSGEPHPETGMIIPLPELDRIVNELLQSLDYKHLNKETDFFKKHLATGEIIIQFLWRELSRRIPGDLLYHLKLWETNNNYFETGREYL